MTPPAKRRRPLSAPYDRPPTAAGLQLCLAVYRAGNTGSAVDPRSVTGSVTPDGWAQW
ncbi:MAG: hypothetical protein ACLQOZ_13050 [Acidimicrobiales bacterium]